MIALMIIGAILALLGIAAFITTLCEKIRTGNDDGGGMVAAVFLFFAVIIFGTLSFGSVEKTSVTGVTETNKETFIKTKSGDLISVSNDCHIQKGDKIIFYNGDTYLKL